MPDSFFSSTLQQLELTLARLVANSLGFIMVVAFAYLLWLLVKKYIHKRRGLTGTLLLITLPRWQESSGRQTEKTAGAHAASAKAQQMFAELHGLTKLGLLGWLAPKETFSFEIVASSEWIKFYLFTPRHLKDKIIAVIQSNYPEAEVQKAPDYNIFQEAGFVDSTRLTIKGPIYAPIKNYQQFAVDPLNSITNKMAKLKKGEALLLQCILTPAANSWRRQGFNYLNKLHRQIAPSSIPQTDTTSGLPKFIEKKLQSKADVIIDQNIQQSIEAKLKEPAFDVIINLVSVAAAKNQATANLKNLTLAFSQFNLSPLSTFYPALTIDSSMISHLFYRTRHWFQLPWSRTKLILNTAEVATLFHLPSPQVTTPRLYRLKAKKAPAPADLPKTGLHLGYNHYRGIKKSIYINREDRRRHMYFLGQTGTGKTELLKYMIYQDILNGEGVCYIDPHGDAVEDLLTKIPKQRVKDVIYFNPADTQRPPGLNILEAKTIEEKHIIINSFIALLYKLYDPNRTGIMGPMLERAVRNVMLTAMEEPGNTLIEVLHLLTSPDFAKTKIPLIKDPVVKTYWTEELARTSDFHKSEMLGYFVSKFDHFVTDVTIRNIIGQPKSAFQFRQAMDSKKIVLINLAKGKLGEENASFLGLLLIPKILTAAMSRHGLPENKRTDFYLYVDEFQNFATPDFIQILSESRKFHLNLIMANQYLEQIPKPIKDALFGNVGSLGSFRVGDEDAAFLEFHFKPEFSKFDLANNLIGSLYFKMLAKGLPTQPFSLSLDWDEVSQIKKSDKIRQLVEKISRIKYGQDRSVVEQDIARRSQLSA